MSDRSERAVAIVGLGAILPDAPSARAFRDNVWAKKYSITEVPPDRWSVADYYDPDPTAPGEDLQQDRRVGARLPVRLEALAHPAPRGGGDGRGAAVGDHDRRRGPRRLRLPAASRSTPSARPSSSATRWRGSGTTSPRCASPSPSTAGCCSRRRSSSTCRPTVRERHPLALARGRREAGCPRSPRTRCRASCRTSSPAAWPTCSTCAGRTSPPTRPAPRRSPPSTPRSTCSWRGHCDAVVTGGVDRNMGTNSFVKFSKIGALSATGTRPFGDGADGFVMGEGSAAFLLKRLADAERDGDRVYAVVRGLGGSSDGKGKGITAPNPIGQQLAIARAWQDAGLDPTTAGLVEAHGTSTKVGDVVEVESLDDRLQGRGERLDRARLGEEQRRPPEGRRRGRGPAEGRLGGAREDAAADAARRPAQPRHRLRRDAVRSRTTSCASGSRRTARRGGAASPPTASAGRTSTSCSRSTCPGRSRRGSGRRRSRCGPSRRRPASAHAAARPPLRGLLVLGAPSVDGLRQAVDGMLARVKDGHVPPVAVPDPADLSARERIAIDYENGKELVERLQKAQKALAIDAPATWRAFQAQGVFRGSGPAPGKIAFLFTGQGSQYVNMGRDLAASDRLVAGVFEEADRVLEPDPRPQADELHLRGPAGPRGRQAGRGGPQADRDHAARRALDGHRDVPAAGRVRPRARHGDGPLARRVRRPGGGRGAAPSPRPWRRPPRAAAR